MEQSTAQIKIHSLLTTTHPVGQEERLDGLLLLERDLHQFT